MIGADEVLRDAFDAHRRRDVGGPNSRRLRQRLERYDRRLLMRRAAIAVAGVLVAIGVGVVTLTDTGGDAASPTPDKPSSAAAASAAPDTENESVPTTKGASESPSTIAAPVTTTTAPLALNAVFTYGTSKADPPFDDYFGIAPPGATVDITPPYGSRSTVANSDGSWALHVEFPGAPAEQTFDVTIASAGVSTTFGFTRLP